MPKDCFDILNNEILSGKHPMDIENFEREILFILRSSKASDLQEIMDVTEGLENTLKKYSNESFELLTFIEKLKSKRYTRTRIQRILLHLLLHITKKEVCNFKYNPQYIRILGFNKTGEKLLNDIYNKANVPVVTSVSKFLKNANETGRIMIEKDILATNIYTLGYQIPSFRKSDLDFTHPMVII